MESNFSAFFEMSKSKFEGQWVVILDKKVVASGTASEIRDKMQKIRKEHPGEMPLIAKVPKHVMQIV